MECLPATLEAYLGTSATQRWHPFGIEMLGCGNTVSQRTSVIAAFSRFRSASIVATADTGSTSHASSGASYERRPIVAQSSPACVPRPSRARRLEVA